MIRGAKWLLPAVCVSVILASAVARSGTFLENPQEALAADGVVFVAEGEPRAAIILPEAFTEGHEKAAELLVEYVGRMSGAELPVVTDPNEVRTGNRIWIGMRPEGGERFPGTDFSFPNPEEFVMVARANELALVGRDETHAGDPVHAGTLLSALTFLQERLGVRWVWPGEGGTDILEAESIAFEPFEFRYHPPLRHRNLRAVNFGHRWNAVLREEERRQAPNKVDLLEEYAGGYEGMENLMQEKDRKAQRWFNLQRVGAHRAWVDGGYFDRAMLGSLRYQAGHAFGDWYGRFAADHPEWFALQPDGLRASEQEEPYPSMGRVKLCVSNPEVAEQWLSDAEEYFNANPEATTLSASPNDYGWRGYCVCDDCKAWDSPEGPMLPRPLEWRDHEEDHYALTDRYVRFWNHLARGLKERFPDREVNIGVWAYCAYEPAPHSRKLAANIIPGYVGIRTRWVGDNPRERMTSHVNTWREWVEKGATAMVWRPNSLKRNAGLPYVYMHRHSDVWNTLAENNIVGFELDSVHHHWANQAPQFYVMTQLVWNPTLSADEILDDFYRRAFGEDAAPHVDAYFSVFEQLYYKVDETHNDWEDASWHFYSGLPHAYRELKLAPTLGRTMADHAWGNYLWERDDARHSAEELAEHYLQQAEAAVAEGPAKYRERLAFLRTGFSLIEPQLAMIEAMNDLREDRGARDEVLARAFRAAELRERLLLENIDNFAFGYPQMLMHYRYRWPHRLGPPEE